MRKFRSFKTKIYKVFYRHLANRIKIDDKTILFVSFHGRGYSCNPKYIHQYMIHHPEYKDYTFIWACKKFKVVKIEHAKVIRYNGWKYFYYLSKAKYWFVNCKLPRHVIKKPGQVYLQTWHGTPLKRLAHDIVVTENESFYRSGMSREEMHNTYDNDVAKYDYMISPNPFSTEKFQSAFQIDRKRLIETGYPRNDFLTNLTNEQILQLREKYHIPEDKKVILYAPTWRDNAYDNRGYVFELQADFIKWKEKLGDEYIVIFKPHYLIANRFKKSKEIKDFIKNIRADRDINELYAISDILITDYSSVFFDFANLNRPMYFYMFDLQSYKEELRGFYFDIYETLPGDIIENEDELLDKILENNYDYDRLKAFNQEFNSLQDGNCSKKVLDIVMKSK